MAVRVKPVRQASPTETPGVENAVHYYRRDVDAKPRPAGSFLGAFIKHSGVPAFFCQSRDTEDYDDFVSRVAKGDADGRECRYVAPGDARGFKDAPVLRIADAAVTPLMWRRRTLGQRRYSIVGEIDSLNAAATQAALMDMLVAPMQHWDALVFPTKTLKSAAENLVAMQAEYLSFRLGGAASLSGVSFVIPPGIDAKPYLDSSENRQARAGVRRRLGIKDDDLCVLATGDFAFYQRQHPTPLYLALEAAARRTGVRIHLLQAGWFDNERIERAYRDAIREFAPAVNAIFLDGREADIRDRVWFAADVYAAFHDAVSHGLDTEMLEAMAAGLPVVASDWGGNRDAIRNAEDGYLIPTWLPLPESGGDLTLAPENEIMGDGGDRADLYLTGTVSQATAVDIRAAAEAFEALAGDPAHRAELGERARKRALDTYDWPMVVRRHQALWSELRRIRGDAAEVAPPVSGRPAMPALNDPFSMFRPFASHAVDEMTKVTLARGIKGGEGIAARLERLRANPINDVARHALLELKEQQHILDHLHERDGIEVIRLAELLPERRRYRLPRTLGWLAKMGMVRLEAQAGVDAAPTPAQGVSLVELGVAARRQGAEDTAVEYFRSALEKDPADPDANRHLGEIMAEANDLETAIRHFEKALQVNDGAVEARLDLGKALFLKGAHQDGIAHLQRAAELAPDNAEAFHLLGVAYRRAGAAEEAMRALERSHRLAPKRADTLLHLAYARKSAGRRAEALQSFRDALRIEPHNMFAHAGEMSLGVERDGRRLAERDAATRRVALHFNTPQQFRPLQRLFESLQGQHWPLLTADGRELVEFKPDVIVTGGVQTPEVRGLAPNALIISAPAFLTSQNRFQRAFDGADIAVAPSPMIAETWSNLGFIEMERIRIAGHLPADVLYAGETIQPAPALRDASSVILYAPGDRPNLSSARLLGDDPVRRIRGARDDVTLVIKPHPETFVRRPQWIERWAEAARAHDRVVLVDDRDADIVPYMVAADVLVADVSSVMFDFLAVDRPILLLRNPAATSDEIGYDAQGIEWRWREIGREIANPDDLARAVDLALKTPDAGTEVRARYRDALFGDTADGRTAERIVELITELST